MWTWASSIATKRATASRPRRRKEACPGASGRASPRSPAKRRQKKAVEKGGRNEYKTSKESKKAILGYLAAGPAKSADVAKAIGLGTTRTNDLLREMILAGDVAASGETRAREYRLAEG